jgi:hypothetical protein
MRDVETIDDELGLLSRAWRATYETEHVLNETRRGYYYRFTVRR